MRPALLALLLACSSAAAPPYRFLLVAGDQWEDDASFLITRPSEFQITAALLKTWGLPFDIARLDQQGLDRYHLLDRDGSPRYGTIIWDAPAAYGRDLSLLAELNAQGVSFVVLGDTVKIAETARLAGIRYISEYKSIESARFDRDHFITRALAGREPELLPQGAFYYAGSKAVPEAAKGIAFRGAAPMVTVLAGYVLEVTGNAVLVAGSDDRGAFYGLQSLRQLIVKDAAKLEIPSVAIRDWPTKPFRGVKLYLPGRGNIAFFKRFVRDFMALYKYNQVIVEMNGAMRLDRHPEISAGWVDLFNDLRFSRRDRSTGPHGEYQDSPNQDVADDGVLEKSEVADLAVWARHYYVDFIPEIPSLTHSYYLLTCHRELAEAPDAEWPDAYCPSASGSYKLLFDVMDEVVEATKPRMVHIGHDEWRVPPGGCPHCGNKDRRELFTEDVNKVHAYLAARGIRVAMYGDHLPERVRGKGTSDQKTRAGYAYKWLGGLTPEQVKKIPRDILLFNWFWRDGKEGNGEANDIQLADCGFQQVYMNFDPGIQNFKRRSGRTGVIGGVPASWAATTEFNFGKDPIYDFLGCANLVWSKHSFEPQELTPIVRGRMRDVRQRPSGEKPPSAEGDAVAEVKFAPGAAATGIQIGEDVSSLIFLHASEKPAANDFAYEYIYNFDDTAALLGHYEILYEDGFVTTVPIRYGVNILERTWGTTRKPRAYCYGADPVEADDGTYFASEWVNPRFGKAIKQVVLKPSPHLQDPVLLKGISMVRKRPFPEPVQARPYETVR